MYKRTLQDRLISSFNSARYGITEPVLLRLARLRHQASYTNRNERPLISITIPTYDRGKLLVERTLPSIFRQTYENFEVIVAGDCCVDDTPEILASVKDPRFRFINLPKRTKYPDDTTLRWFVSGVAPSNYGIDVARGKWITYFDDDDIMAPDFLESLLEFAQSGDHEFVAGLCEAEREGVLSVQGRQQESKPEFGCHCTWMYRSYLRFFKYNINSWRKSYNCPQDIDFQLRMKHAGVRMKSLDKVVSYIRPRPGLNTIGLDARLVAAKEKRH